MIRRLVTILIVAAATTSGSLYWLHDGDLHQIAQEATSLPAAAGLPPVQTLPTP